ncbi:MAG: HD-GYP domain-containing protein [Planctomycetota bacterium]
MDTSLENANTLALAPVPVAAGGGVTPRSPISDEARHAVAALGQSFAQAFSIVDVQTGDLVHADYGSLGCDFYEKVAVLAEVSRRGTPEIVEAVSPLLVLAIPLSAVGVTSSLVAVAVFVDRSVATAEETTAAARALGVDAERTLRWSREQSTWSAEALQQMAVSNVENLRLRKEVSRLNSEVADANAHIQDVYAELELLHRLTGQLHLSDNEEDLWRSALGWLADTVPAQCLTIVMRGDVEGRLERESNRHWTVLNHGECPTSRDELCELIRRFGPKSLEKPLLLNRSETVLPTWHVPTIRELVCVPIDGQERPRGWLLALNHQGDDTAKFHEFGSVEIQLLSSVGTILGIHHSNLGLYRDQSQLFSSSVQALTSAIDAKDRYTSGHSNRVAYFSVSIAQRMGLNKAERDTLYLAGLLHDIGKIGIDDNVLNKAGTLTDQEYEQIKLHPQLGYEILRGVKQLDQVLPMVLHHHEAWDGSGYPHGLAGDDIPKMARIMAVADAFDAMTSDRPYRKGMSDGEVDEILRVGAGSQWDPEVVNAFFQIRDEIRRIVEVSSCQASLQREDCLS